MRKVGVIKLAAQTERYRMAERFRVIGNLLGRQLMDHPPKATIAVLR